MAAPNVDLGVLVGPLQREVQGPIDDAFVSVPESMWIGYLKDGFWTGYIDGFFRGYTITGDAVGPVDLTQSAMPGQLQQLIVLYAGDKLLRARLSNLGTSTRSKAGPVEFEQQFSSQLLRDLLADFRARRLELIKWLGIQGYTTAAVVDLVSARICSEDAGLLPWWR